MSEKCPYCGGDNLYLKRTWPVYQYGCRDCEKMLEELRKCGLTTEQLKKVWELFEKRAGLR